MFEKLCDSASLLVIKRGKSTPIQSRVSRQFVESFFSVSSLISLQPKAGGGGVSASMGLSCVLSLILSNESDSNEWGPMILKCVSSIVAWHGLGPFQTYPDLESLEPFGDP